MYYVEVWSSMYQHYANGRIEEIEQSFEDLEEAIRYADVIKKYRPKYDVYVSAG